MALSSFADNGIEITIDENFETIYTFPLDPLPEVSVASNVVDTVQEEIRWDNVVGADGMEITIDNATNGPENEEISLLEGAYYDVEIIELPTESETREMPQLRTVKASKTIEYALHCEWEGCQYASDDVWEFVYHVSYHMPDLEVKENNNGEEFYACLWYSCGFETADTGEIKRHVNYHSFHSKVKCVGKNLVEQRPELEECKFPGELVNEVPEFPYAFKCRWDRCGKEFNNAQYYFDHVNLHVQQMKYTLPENKKSVPCLWENCRYSFQIKPCGLSRLSMHIRTHSQEKLAACPKCGALFATKTKLVDHLNRQYTTEEFQCSNCGKYFSTERLLRDHMRLHINHHKCAFCDWTCPTPRMLSIHIRYRHLTDRPFKCSHCSFAGKSIKDLNDHANHHDLPQFECEEDGCGFKCRSSYGLHAHTRRAHGEEVLRYCCHLCELRFLRGAHLTKHLQHVHEIDRPNGHSRFRYKMDEMGFYRLETIRYESVDTTQVAMKVDFGSRSKSKQVCVTIAQLDETGKVVEERKMLADQLAMVPVEPPQLPAQAERRHFQFK